MRSEREEIALIIIGFVTTAIKNGKLDEAKDYIATQLKEYAGSQTKWTDGDVDAAYILGIINTSSNDLPKDTFWASMQAVQDEGERLKTIGFDRPHEAIRALRYGKNKG